MYLATLSTIIRAHVPHTVYVQFTALFQPTIANIVYRFLFAETERSKQIVKTGFLLNVT